MINRPFVVAVELKKKKKKKRKKNLSADFLWHMYKMHSGGPVLTNLGDKAGTHCFILSFQRHEVGSEASCMILSWEPGKHPAQEKLFQMVWKRNSGRPCMLCPWRQKKCQHLLETLDSDHCSVFLMLHHMFPAWFFSIVINFWSSGLDPWPRQLCSKAEDLVPFPSVLGNPLAGTSFQLLGMGWEFSFWCIFGWVDDSSLFEMLEGLPGNCSLGQWVAQICCRYEAEVHSGVYPCTEHSL